MEQDERFMQRCLDLASQGLGKVAPNPMVGAVLVYNGNVLGEGYHRRCGEPHAEVIAVESVKNKELLKKCTLYVSLEPCSHHGRTPPCTDLITRHKIPRVVIGSTDTNPLVAGKGIQRLLDTGCEVKTGVLEKACRDLNRRFYIFHEKKRPYIILKWAQTSDGFIDMLRKEGQDTRPVWITGEPERRLVHKWRSEEASIMVGTRTALKDNPRLNVRHWEGQQPLRLVIDRNRSLPRELHLFDDSQETWVFTGKEEGKAGRVEWIKLDFTQSLTEQLLKVLFSRDIQSLFVEGGAALLQSFINDGSWDEARVFTGRQRFENGVAAPRLKVQPESEFSFEMSTLRLFRNRSTEEFAPFVPDNF